MEIAEEKKKIHHECLTGHIAAIFEEIPAMICNASSNSKSQKNALYHWIVWQGLWGTNILGYFLSCHRQHVTPLSHCFSGMEVTSHLLKTKLEPNRGRLDRRQGQWSRVSSSPHLTSGLGPPPAVSHTPFDLRI